MLDTFFGEIASTCDGSKPFEVFRRSVAAKYGHDADGKPLKTKVSITAPADIREAIGPISAKNKGQHTAVVVPLSGKFKSLPVVAVEFVFGNENGLNMTIVRFSAQRSEVTKVLGPDIKRADYLLKRRVKAGETGADQSIALDDEKGQTRLICDTSN